MLGGGFMAQANQTNKQNREMLKKHKKEQRQFLSGIDQLEKNGNEQNSTAIPDELRSRILRELDAKKRKQQMIGSIVRVIIFGAMFLAIVLMVIARVTKSF